ncbi:hypothetical protein L3X38_004290 [Prunus dulcis]|uniref:Uncharacterized protein n=1 Tax=Prunus dulcis TaxID=3755 RepID=A0AAD4ZNQ5_PRUDU|nr:hypothetical protein L3X38_004290 [Prunus dulcis]
MGVICGCEELSKWFDGCPVVTTAVWRGCGASGGGWMTWQWWKLLQNAGSSYTLWWQQGFDRSGVHRHGGFAPRAFASNHGCLEGFGGLKNGFGARFEYYFALSMKVPICGSNFCSTRIFV